MTGRELRNVAASVHQRLLTQARATNRPFGEVLQYFAMERFLYRLPKSPHAETVILKGALMLHVLVGWDDGTEMAYVITVYEPDQ